MPTKQTNKTDPTLADVDMIGNTPDLERLIDALARQPYVAIDTEFLRDTTYWPDLCLIQLASPGGHKAIIDPLSRLDLSVFYRFLTDSAPVKVFHAARQDVEIFYQQGKAIPAPLFDTQIAAMVCGHGDSAGYETLVRQIAKASIDKSSRFSDWTRRPLSDKQLSYAISDVTHLCVVYEHLKQEVESAGRDSWIEEELAVLTSPATYNTDPADAWKRLKLRDTRPANLAAAIELAAWRERMAQARNVPRARILRDDALCDVAVHRPADKQALSRMRSIPKGWSNSELAEGMLQALAAAAERPAGSLPRIEHARRAPLPPARIDLLKTLLKSRSEKSGVAAKLIATTDTLEAFARGEPEGDALRHGWRAEIFGNDADKLLTGQAALALAGDEVELVPR